MLRLFLFILALTTYDHIQGQIEKAPQFKLHGSQFSVRNTLSPAIEYEPQDLIKLNTRSQVLIPDLFEFRNTSPSVQAENVDLEYLIKFEVRNKAGNYEKARLRLGVSLGYSFDFSGHLSRQEEFRIDSFGNSDFKQVTIDSFFTKSFSVSQSSNRANIHVSYIVNSNPIEKINMFFGVGISAGLLFNRYSYTDYFESHSRITHRIDSNNLITTRLERLPTRSSSDMFRESNLFQFMPFGTLGFNYQVSIKKAFWKKVFVGYEVRPAARFLNHRFIGQHKFTHIDHGITVNYRI